MPKKLLETKFTKAILNSTLFHQVQTNVELDFFYADFETTLSKITNSPTCLISAIRQLNFALIELDAIEASHTQKKYTHICA